MFAWQKLIFLLVAAPEVRSIVMLAGASYAENLVALLHARGVEVERPMARLRQGEQLSWLKRNT